MAASATGPVLVTFGHGTASKDEITDLLHGASVTRLVDVRTAPGSRHNPHVARAALEQWLPERAIAYRWDRRLGGFRQVPAESPDRYWRLDAFRGYAAHMRTAEFRTGVDDLLAACAAPGTAIMCAETLWWRCHRRMIADFVRLARGGHVQHLMHDGTLRTHRPTDGARLRSDGLLVYDGDPEPPS